DVNGDGRADIVGFGNDGTFVALATPDGRFGNAFFGLAEFGSTPASGGWTSDDLFHRTLGDVNGDGRADIVGFGNDGTYVSLAVGGGFFNNAYLAVAGIGSSPAGGGSTIPTTYPLQSHHLN